MNQNTIETTMTADGDAYLVKPKIVFVERTPGVYTSKEGCTITRSKLPVGESLSETEFRFSAFQMHDANGKLMAESHFIRDFERDISCELYSYHDRTGRSGTTDHDLKFCAQHFPEGTVVEVNDDVASKAYGDPTDIPRTIFTVDHVAQNGPGSYLCVMKEKRKVNPARKSDLDDLELMYNISHIKRIVTPGTGKLRLAPYGIADAPKDQYSVTVQDWRDYSETWADGWQFGDIKLGRNEVIAHSLISTVTEIIADIGFDSENAGKWIDEHKLMGFVTNLNMGREVTTSAEGGDRRHKWVHQVVNLKKLRKWLKSNQHRIFYTKKFTIAEDNRQIDAAYAEDLLNDLDDSVPVNDDNPATVEDHDER